MTTKTYGQMCPLARSLDVLGERWTFLVIRELLLGPERFKHLLAALPAIGSNRLSDRLRGLEDAGSSGRPCSGSCDRPCLRAHRRRRAAPGSAARPRVVGARPPPRRSNRPGDRPRRPHRAVPHRHSDRAGGPESPGNVRVPRRRRGVPSPAATRPVPGPIRSVADRPDPQGCLRSSDLHGTRASSADPIQALKDRRVTILHGTRTSLTEVFRVLAYTPLSRSRRVVAGKRRTSGLLPNEFDGSIVGIVGGQRIRSASKA